MTEKNEVGNLPGYASLGETQKKLISELLNGFSSTVEFIEWEQRTIHACFGNEEAVYELKKLTQPFLEEMYKNDGKEHKKFFRQKVAQYLINSVFPLPQRFFSHRAREDPTGEKKGMYKEEADPFEGGI